MSGWLMSGTGFKPVVAKIAGQVTTKNRKSKTQTICRIFMLGSFFLLVDGCRRMGVTWSSVLRQNGSGYRDLHFVPEIRQRKMKGALSVCQSSELFLEVHPAVLLEYYGGLIV